MARVLIAILALLVILAVGLLAAWGRRGGATVGRRRAGVGGFFSFLATAIIANAFVIGNEGDLGAGGGDAGDAGSGPA